jgi:hypothetical protein
MFCQQIEHKFKTLLAINYLKEFLHHFTREDNNLFFVIKWISLSKFEGLNISQN